MTTMTESGILALAEDPTLIKGIYEACDQWCAYCPVTDRCLAFRASGADPETGIWDTSASDDLESIGEGMVFAKALAEVGRSYMNLSDAYLASRPGLPPDLARRASGPTPLDVFAWFHVLAPARIFRAILNTAEAADGIPGRHEDALCAAKVALIGIDRSGQLAQQVCELAVGPGKRKSPRFRRIAGSENNPGSDLLSHAPTRAVPSAVAGLTSVFGMGTGVTLLL